MSNNETKFTGRTYRCPTCGDEIKGVMEHFWQTPMGKIYINQRPYEDSDEDNDMFIWREVAGCIRCLDQWDIKKDELEDISEEKVILS